MRAGRVYVLGCPVDPLDMEATVALCEQLIEARRPAFQISINAAKIVAARNDTRLRTVIGRADVVSADGQAVIWAARLLGQPLPERVAGIDLMLRLVGRAAECGWRVFLLGAEKSVLAKVSEELERSHPLLEICGSQHGWFHDHESDRVREEIAAARTDLLFVAMSSPRKEYWISENARTAGVPLAVGVGGAFDVIAGERRRAPRVLQRIGLEWLFRLAQEPRRLGPRYADTNLRFAVALILELIGRRLGARS